MQYRISPDLFDAHPGYRRGVVVVRGAVNDGPGAAIETLLRAAEQSMRDAHAGANVAELPWVACWRDAYRRFGAKPSEHRSSIEAMSRRVLKPDRLPSINPLVDIGNLVSLNHRLPAGVHPLPAPGPDIELRPARPGDAFAPPDGGASETPPDGEVVFVRGGEVLTRRWTWRQAAGTQTLAHTTDVFFNIDGLPPIGEAGVRAAMREVEALVLAHAGGRVVASVLLTAQHPSFEIPPA